MKIRIKEVPSAGLHKEAVYDPKALDMEIQDSKFALPIKFSTPIEAMADIKIIDKELIIEVQVKYGLKMICSRCLEEFELPFEKKYLFNYNTRSLEEVDITDKIREEIILEYPLKPLCSQNCKGICPGCGANLNFEKCRCQ